MTDYARMAQQHWARWLPQRYSQIPNPTEFFFTLGRQAELEIEDLALELAGPDLPDETYLQAVGRLNNARQRAREQILPEQILLTPEPGVEDEDETETPEDSPRDGEQTPPAAGEWIPVVLTPDHPYWHQLREQERWEQE